MKLSRITGLPYGIQAIAVDGFQRDKVYAADSLSRYRAEDMSRQPVGETPNERMPATLCEVPEFCDNWISFLQGSLAADLGAPADITRPLLRGLCDAMQGIQDRPALPDGLRKLPQVQYSKLNDVAEVLRTYRDWSKAAAASTQRPPPPKEPPPPRLSIDLVRKTITLDGMTDDVPSNLALRWVKVLAERPGEWISSTELKGYDQELDGTRPDRLKKHLPPAIRLLIDSDRRKGSRLRLSQKP